MTAGVLYWRLKEDDKWTYKKVTSSEYKLVINSLDWDKVVVKFTPQEGE